jgi:hypothetical protein
VICGQTGTGVRPRVNTSLLATAILRAIRVSRVELAPHCRANARSDCGVRLLTPPALSLAPCSPPSRTLRVATRWPAAILDRGCARRPAHDQAGTEKRCSRRTKKLASARQRLLAAVVVTPLQEQPKFHSPRRGGQDSWLPDCGDRGQPAEDHRSLR